MDLLLSDGSVIDVLGDLSAAEALWDVPVVGIVPADLSQRDMETLSRAAARLCARPGTHRAPIAQILYEEILREDGRMVTEAAPFEG
jgi:hypothetical protein